MPSLKAPEALAHPSEIFSVEARWMGQVPYGQGLSLQEELVLERQRGQGSNTLFLLEHPPVVTLGRGADPRHLLLDPAQLHQRGVQVFETGRGGDITYHGPGQLVGYPVLLLPHHHRDLHHLLRNIEEVLIQTAASFGVQATRMKGLTGIWVDGEKLAAIGLRVARWVTSHGFALNVSTDLSGFEMIVPCGIRGRGVTSLEKLLGKKLPLPLVAAEAARCFARVFGAQMSPLDPSLLSPGEKNV